MKPRFQLMLKTRFLFVVTAAGLGNRLGFLLAMGPVVGLAWHAASLCCGHVA